MFSSVTRKYRYLCTKHTRREFKSNVIRKTNPQVKKQFVLYYFPPLPTLKPVPSQIREWIAVVAPELNSREEKQTKLSAGVSVAACLSFCIGPVINGSVPLCEGSCGGITTATLSATDKW